MLKSLSHEFHWEDSTAEVESTLIAMQKELRFGHRSQPQGTKKRFAVAPDYRIFMTMKRTTRNLDVC